MAVLEIPSQLRIRAKKFGLGVTQQTTPINNGGALQTIQRAAPSWIAEYTSSPLFDEELGIAEAFFDTLNGSIGSFRGWNPTRIMPVAYRTQSVLSDPWTQVGQTAPRVTASSYGASTLSLDRLLNGAKISSGDLIQFKVGNTYYLFRVAASLTVSGTTADVTVNPRPPASIASPVAITYRKAGCEMKMIGQPEESSSVDGGTIYTFKAVQLLRP